MKNKTSAVAIILAVAFFVLPIGPLANHAAAAGDNNRAIVLIKSFTKSANGYLTQFGQGSGVVISSDGVILTNYHVIAYSGNKLVSDSTYQVCVSQDSGSQPDCSYVATLVAGNADLDVALLKILPVGSASIAGLPFLVMASADTANANDQVSAMGYPAIGGSTLTISKGIISGKIDNLYNKKWLKTDALVSFGSSGGALIDASGKLIGITTALSSDLSSSLGYAINIVSIYDWVNKNIGNATITSPLLDRLIALTAKTGSVNASNSLDDASLPFSITKPDGWSFEYSGENVVYIYNKSNPDSGKVTVSIQQMPYAIPVNAASSVLKRYFNERGASSLVSISQDRAVTINGNNGRQLTVSALGKSSDYYAFAIGRQFVLVGLSNGTDSQDKDIVQGIVNSIKLRTINDNFKELKTYSKSDLKLSLTATGNWAFADNLSYLDIYNKRTYDAYGMLSFKALSDNEKSMTNQQYLDNVKTVLQQANQITGLIDYRVDIVDSAANVTIGKIKNVIRINSIEKNVSDNKIFAYNTDYIILLGDYAIDLNLTVYNSNKAVYNKSLAEFNSLLKNLSVDVNRRAMIQVVSLIDRQDYIQASKIADQISDINQRVVVLTNIAAEQIAQGQAKAAVATAQKIVKLKPKDYLALYYLGLAYSNASDLKSAEKYLLASIKAKGDYRASRNTLGTVYIDMKNWNKAIEQLQKAIALDPGNAKAYANLGLVYFQMNKFDLALDPCVKALELNAGTPVLADNVVAVINYRVGYIYAQKSNCSQATPYLEEFLKSYPNDQDASNLLGQCQQLSSGNCPVGTHVENRQCFEDTQLCNANGTTGQKTWTGSGFGACQAMAASCGSGYQSVNGVCTAIVSSNAQPSNWRGVNQTGGWQSIALSANGQYVIASSDFVGDPSNNPVMSPGGYVSSDGGSSWSKKFTYSSNLASSNSSYLAISDNGKYQAALFVDSFTNKVSNIYLSSDFGNTWRLVKSIPFNSGFLTSLAMSADGSTIAASEAIADRGHIIISRDFGANWTDTDSGNNGSFKVSISSDGSRIVAFGRNSNKVILSSNYGKTWTDSIVPLATPGAEFSDAAISGNGQYIIIASGLMSDKNDYLYVSSDYGKTWSAKLTDAKRFWQAVAISGDGKNQMALQNESRQIFVSSDYGQTWASQDTIASRGVWKAAAFSRDGNHRGLAAYWENILVSP